MPSLRENEVLDVKPAQEQPDDLFLAVSDGRIFWKRRTDMKWVELVGATQKDPEIADVKLSQTEEGKA